MTHTEIKWAAQHDWYISLDPAQEGSILVYECWTNNGVTREKIVSFSDFKALCYWAGY